MIKNKKAEQILTEIVKKQINIAIRKTQQELYK